MAAPNIGHSIVRVVNFFVVVILVLILLNLLGAPISNALPSAAQNFSNMLYALWDGVKGLVPNDYYTYHHR
jgi:hypothetical protein